MGEVNAPLVRDSFSEGALSPLSLSLPGQVNGEGHDWGPLPASDTRVLVPVEALPSALRDFTAGLSEQLQVPPDLVLLLALATVAGATRGRWQVQGPSPDWHEHLSLYTAVFLPPGEMKSPTLREVAAPLREYERHLLAVTSDHVARESERRLLLEHRLKSLRQQVARRPLDTELAAEYDEAQLQFAQCPVVHEPRLLVQDVTPERLATLLAERFDWDNYRRTAWWRALLAVVLSVLIAIITLSLLPPVTR